MLRRFQWMARCGFDQMKRVDGRLPNEIAAFGLLERSIFYDHPDLAVIRLSLAVDVRARIPDAAWAAQRSADPALRRFFEAASQRHDTTDMVAHVSRPHAANYLEDMSRASRQENEAASPSCRGGISAPTATAYILPGICTETPCPPTASRISKFTRLRNTIPIDVIRSGRCKLGTGLRSIRRWSEADTRARARKWCSWKALLL
jgi:hypothetical protein